MEKDAKIYAIVADYANGLVIIEIKLSANGLVIIEIKLSSMQL